MQTTKSILIAAVLLILAAVPLAAEEPIIDSDREHWSYQPLDRPDEPEVDDAAWCRTPIDRFILHALEQQGLRPLPEADRATLLRRVTFDLTGLPPTPAEIEAFVADDDPRAWERLVDRLLDSRAYGERWAQHWLDLARFAETDGFEHDHVRPNAWRYRDWVIDALNNDMPYDEFVRQQLAGDEFSPGDPSAAIATGFLLCGPDMPDINLQEERRHNFLDDMTATVGSVFLGVQMGCARCHDHMYDPISQLDFYRLRAFFDPVDIFREHPIPTPDDEASRAAFEAERNRQWKALELEIARLTDEDAEQNADEIQKLQRELDAVKNSEPPRLPHGRVVRERTDEPEASFLWVRGDFRRRGPAVQPAYLRVVNYVDEEPRAPMPMDHSSGRRSALADWLTRPDHPLATRVIVNRVWQHHFGEGLSATPSDFGVMGELPTHPELLDWLATELPRLDWSLKRLHRLIVTSATYRTASRPDSADDQDWQALVTADPDNELLGRMRTVRLEGEAIRDAMLASADRLSPNAGGPGVRPPLPAEVVSTLLRDQWPVTENEEDHRRRSIYLFVRRNLRYPLFEVFDRPDTNQSCPSREQTTIAPQALHLLNSEFSLECAEQLAAVVREESGEAVDARIAGCYLRALSRAPAADELAAAREFLAAGGDDALTDLCLALFNTNEFIYVD